MQFIRTSLYTFLAMQLIVVTNVFGQTHEWGSSGTPTWTLDKITMGRNFDFAIRDIHIYKDLATFPLGAPYTDKTSGLRLQVIDALGANNTWDVYAESTSGFQIRKIDEPNDPLTGFRLWSGNQSEQYAAQRAGLWTDDARTHFQIGDYRPITFSSTGGNGDGIFGAYMGFNAYLGQPENLAATVTKMEGNFGGSILATDYNGNVELQTFDQNTATQVTGLTYNPQFTFSNKGTLEFKSQSEAWTDSHWGVIMKSELGSAWTISEPNSDGNYMGIGMTEGGWYFIRSKNAPGATANLDGTCGKYAFVVTKEGKAIAREVEVSRTGWCDYVFADDYDLAELSEVEAYIQENKHLPGVPSETEVINNGLQLGEMSAIHMQKIEELTLYVIELQKNYEKLQRQNEHLQTQMSALQK